MKGISIITNFGCNANCWYCIWKGHKLANCKSNIDYNKLEEFLLKYKHLGKVSLSGGGDPLYNCYDNMEFWFWIVGFIHSHDIKLDIHTRVKLYERNFWSNHVNLCAFSSDFLENDKEYLIYLSKLTKVRIIHVVVATDTVESIKEYIEFCELNNMQLTLKQLCGYDDGGNYNKFKELFLNAYFLDNDDYNIYFMPDNKVYDKFLL